jgi:hypothetical protein
MYVASRKPISSFTIIRAITTKPLDYPDYRGKTVEVPINTLVYVDTAANIALIGHDYVDIAEDEYRELLN